MDIKQLISNAKETWEECREECIYEFLEFLKDIGKFVLKVLIVGIVVFLGIRYILNINPTAPKNTPTYKLNNIVGVSRGGNLSDLTLYVKNGNSIKPIELSITYSSATKYVMDAKETMWAELADCKGLDRSINFVDYVTVHIKDAGDLPH